MVNIQFTVLALIKKELYLTAKHMKKHEEDKKFIIKSVVHLKVRNVINYKIIF